eukprot:4734553-Pleurochrysis_carterae.AAC.4
MEKLATLEAQSQWELLHGNQVKHAARQCKPETCASWQNDHKEIETCIGMLKIAPGNIGADFNS